MKKLFSILQSEHNPNSALTDESTNRFLFKKMNHPCHDSQVNRLRKIEGQVRGLQKMIEERRYCMDIVSQLRAVQGALKKVELGILETHLQHCVQDALNSRNSEDAEAKIQEIIQLLQKN